MTHDRAGVGSWLRAMREGAGLSMAALGRRIGSATSTISRIETAQMGIEAPLLAAWATACGWPFDFDRAVGGSVRLVPPSLAQTLAGLSPESLAAVTSLAERLARAEAELAALRALGAP